MRGLIGFSGGVYRLDVVGIPHAVGVLLVRGDDGFTLIDTGISSSPAKIRAALGSLGAGASDLKRIFVTHYHDDHTGGLEEMVAWSGAEVWASEGEAEVLTGERRPDLSSNSFMRRMSQNARPPQVEVTRRLKGGDQVAGFRVIETPGHTLGHASLLRDSDGLLFTAEASGPCR